MKLKLNTVLIVITGASVVTCFMNAISLKKVRTEVETLKIDQEIVRLSGKKHPKLLFIPTASHDSTYYVNDLRQYFKLQSIVRQTQC